MINLAAQNMAKSWLKIQATSLNFDFTFEILQEPPFYVLVSMYKNTSFYTLKQPGSPTLLGPVLLYHQKSEEIV